MLRDVSPLRLDGTEASLLRRAMSPMRCAKVDSLRSIERIKRIEEVISELGKPRDVPPPPPPPAVRAMHTGKIIQCPIRPLRMVPTAMVQDPDSPVYESGGYKTRSKSPILSLLAQRSPSPLQRYTTIGGVQEGSPMKNRRLMAELAAEWQQKALEMQNRLIEHKHSVASHKGSLDLQSRQLSSLAPFASNFSTDRPPPPPSVGNSVHTADINDLVGLDDLQQLAVDRINDMGRGQPIRYDVLLRQQAEQVASGSPPPEATSVQIHKIPGLVSDVEALDAALSQWGPPEAGKTHIGLAVVRGNGETVIAAAYSP
eukprot:TRINITY_DN17227_c0_g1_i1.p1 TRINITY_DN17227_c0_g1~~TRINITY_DN17227_c0_g1_i1.p1  ORF type:complete len:314 (+),score=31.95 TRINITY_DN17227_c0_g1_i1:6-947(+)